MDRSESPGHTTRRERPPYFFATTTEEKTTTTPMASEQSHFQTLARTVSSALPTPSPCSPSLSQDGLGSYPEPGVGTTLSSSAPTTSGFHTPLHSSHLQSQRQRQLVHHQLRQVKSRPISIGSSCSSVGMEGSSSRGGTYESSAVSAFSETSASSFDNSTVDIGTTASVDEAKGEEVGTGGSVASSRNSVSGSGFGSGSGSGSAGSAGSLDGVPDFLKRIMEDQARRNLQHRNTTATNNTNNAASSSSPSQSHQSPSPTPSYRNSIPPLSNSVSSEDPTDVSSPSTSRHHSPMTFYSGGGQGIIGLGPSGVGMGFQESKYQHLLSALSMPFSLPAATLALPSPPPTYDVDSQQGQVQIRKVAGSGMGRGGGCGDGGGNGGGSAEGVFDLVYVQPLSHSPTSMMIPPAPPPLYDDPEFGDDEDDPDRTFPRQQEITPPALPTEIRDDREEEDGDPNFLDEGDRDRQPLPPPPPLLEEFEPPENFAMVCPSVYRSSFPKAPNFPYLKTLRLKSVLTLVQEDYPEENLDFLKEEGIEFFQLGIPGNKEPFVQIPEDKIRSAMELVMDSRNHPILIHCNKGKHRTGCLVGCLRKIQDWSQTSIFEEYRIFSHPKSRSMDQQFIELFDIDTVWKSVDRTFLPVWAVPPN